MEIKALIFFVLIIYKAYKKGEVHLPTASPLPPQKKIPVVLLIILKWNVC